jgi:hypothetical protein
MLLSTKIHFTGGCIIPVYSRNVATLAIVTIINRITVNIGTNINTKITTRIRIRIRIIHTLRPQYTCRTSRVAHLQPRLHIHRAAIDNNARPCRCRLHADANVSNASAADATYVSATKLRVCNPTTAAMARVPAAAPYEAAMLYVAHHRPGAAIASNSNLPSTRTNPWIFPSLI